MLLGLGRGPPGRGPPGRVMSAGLGRPAGGRGPAGRAPGWPVLAGPGWPGCTGCPGRGPRGAEPIPVAVELNGLFPGRGPGRGAPREPPGRGAPDRGGPDGGSPGRGPAGRGAGAVCGGDPATGGAPSTGTLGTGACGRVTTGAGPAAAGAGVAAGVRSVAAAGPAACGLMSGGLIPAAGASTEGACGRAGPGRGALRPPFCPPVAAPSATAPAGTAPAGPAPLGTGATGAPSDGSADLGLRAWAFGAWAENSSLSLRTTGASIVDDAERTNSPISWSLAITALLSTPNSFASSYTRTFATALPLSVRLIRTIVAGPGQRVLRPASASGAHRRVLIARSSQLIPLSRQLLPFPPQPRPLSPGGPAKVLRTAPPGTPRACWHRTVPAGAGPAETPFGAALARSIPGGDAGTRPGRATALEGRERCRPLPPPSAASQTWPHGSCNRYMCGSQARPALAARTVWSLSR
jgi:hypothetical protein